jgi:predicted phage terminase large subunit-like protein
MLFVPPRHGKSEMVTIRYPVWRLEQDPAMRVVVAAYNQTLADKFSRKSRKIARARGIALNDERTAVEDWETQQGGGMRAVGVGGGITGQGGHLVIIDDPVKSREEANSKVYRDKVWDWYTDDLYTRLEPGGAVILIMTRWHEDDLAGRILNSEEGKTWAVISLPAEAGDNDPLGRKPGEPLCPDRFDKEALERIRTVLGTRSYWALYQQAPQPAEGEVFKQDWFSVVDAEHLPRKWDALARYWDKAATAGGGDYTAGVLMGRAGPLYYILDVQRGRWSTWEREQRIKDTAGRDREKYGPGVIVWQEQEPGSGGADSAQATVRNLAGFSIRTHRPTGSKQVRAEPFSAQAEAGNVKVLRAAWNMAYFDELCAFPNGTNDDQVDGSSGAFNRIGEQGWVRAPAK